MARGDDVRDGFDRGVEPEPEVKAPQRRLGWSLVAGVSSTAWTAIVTLATVPLYLHYLGIEAYGLIGFFAAMQGVFALLEVGLSQTINREVARSSADHERRQARDLLHTLALGYWAVAGAIAIGVWAAARPIAGAWLVSAGIDRETLSRAVALMGLVVACRFPLSLYLGALMGARRMALASGIEILMVTVANLGAVVILATVSANIQAFFLWQALVALANVALVRAVAWRALGLAKGGLRPRFDPSGVRRVRHFTIGVAIAAVVGMVFVQGDKIILSRMVGLADLGRYTLAGVGARSLYVLVAPVFGAVFPQLASLHAAGDTEGIVQLYRSGARLMMAVIVPVAAYAGLFAQDIFSVWTGDAQLAKSISVVVPLLLVGTALNGAMHFPYALQLAYGKSSLTMVINVTLLAVFVPLVMLLCSRYGIVGAAGAWALLNVMYLILGVWLTHRELLRGVGGRWIAGDVGVPVLVGVLLMTAGVLAIQRLDLGVPARMTAGAVLAALSILAIFSLSPGLLPFARRLFAPSSPLPTEARGRG